MVSDFKLTPTSFSSGFGMSHHRLCTSYGIKLSCVLATEVLQNSAKSFKVFHFLADECRVPHRFDVDRLERANRLEVRGSFCVSDTKVLCMKRQFEQQIVGE